MWYSLPTRMSPPSQQSVQQINGFRRWPGGKQVRTKSLKIDIFIECGDICENNKLDIVLQFIQRLFSPFVPNPKVRVNPTRSNRLPLKLVCDIRIALRPTVAC